MRTPKNHFYKLKHSANNINNKLKKFSYLEGLFLKRANYEKPAFGKSLFARRKRFIVKTARGIRNVPYTSNEM